MPDKEITPEYQKCPVCNGNGQVPGGFYTHSGNYPYWDSDHSLDICLTCKGTGIIQRPVEVIDNEH